MLEAYSLGITVPAGSAVPFNNVTVEKGSTALLESSATIQLNRCGVYMVACDGSAATACKLQLFKDGVAVAQAQSSATGATAGSNSLSFVTLVQVNHSNCECNCCSSPVALQVKNTSATPATLNNVNVVITKIC